MLLGRGILDLRRNRNLLGVWQVQVSRLELIERIPQQSFVQLMYVGLLNGKLSLNDLGLRLLDHCIDVIVPLLNQFDLHVFLLHNLLEFQKLLVLHGLCLLGRVVLGGTEESGDLWLLDHFQPILLIPDDVLREKPSIGLIQKGLLISRLLTQLLLQKRVLLLEFLILEINTLVYLRRSEGLLQFVVLLLSNRVLFFNLGPIELATRPVELRGLLRKTQRSGLEGVGGFQGLARVHFVGIQEQLVVDLTLAVAHY